MRPAAALTVVFVCAAGLALAFAPGDGAWAADQDIKISSMVSDLQRIQVEMAMGDKTAYARQIDRLHAIGEAIDAAPADVWKDKNETDSAATFVLSGGPVRPIARLLQSGAVPDSEYGLLRGALAYASGREREALTLLEGVDAKTVGLRLGGQLAYAQSVLVTGKDPHLAIQLLDLARLLAPGSLIEEAALRREILVTGDQRDRDRVIFLARQYVTRFPHSIYAENFIQGLSQTSVRYGLVNSLTDLAKFNALLTLVTPEQRREFLLTLARAQTIGGRYEVAGAAADQILGDLPPGAPEETRARFYQAAAKIQSPEFDVGVAALKSIDVARLGRADQRLFHAVLYVSEHLRDAPDEIAFRDAAREDNVAAARSPIAAGDHSRDPVGATIQSAEALLKNSDDLIRQSEAMP